MILNSGLVLSGGSLAVSDRMIVTGLLTLQGGVLKQATIEPLSPANLTLSSGTLDQVTIQGDLVIGKNSGVRVLNGLTLNGTATLGDADGYGVLDFDNTQTLSGTGTIRFGSANANNTLLVNNDGVTLTIGPNITITGQSGTIGYNNDFGGSSNVAVINQGRMVWTNATNIRWTTPLQNTIGRIEVDGNGNFDVGGRLIGGGITTQAGARFSSGMLDQVTIQGDLVIGKNSAVRVLNGLTLNGTATLGDADGYGVLDFDNTQTLSGTGTIRFGSANANNTLLLNNDGVTLTIVPT